MSPRGRPDAWELAIPVHHLDAWHRHACRCRSSTTRAFYLGQLCGLGLHLATEHRGPWGQLFLEVGVLARRVAWCERPNWRALYARTTGRVVGHQADLAPLIAAARDAVATGRHLVLP